MGTSIQSTASIALSENRLFVTMCKLALSTSFSLSLQTRSTRLSCSLHLIFDTCSIISIRPELASIREVAAFTVVRATVICHGERIPTFVMIFQPYPPHTDQARYPISLILSL